MSTDDMKERHLSREKLTKAGGIALLAWILAACGAQPQATEAHSTAVPTANPTPTSVEIAASPTAVEGRLVSDATSAQEAIQAFNDWAQAAYPDSSLIGTDAWGIEISGGGQPNQSLTFIEVADGPSIDLFAQRGDQFIPLDRHVQIAGSDIIGTWSESGDELLRAQTISGRTTLYVAGSGEMLEIPGGIIAPRLVAAAEATQVSPTEVSKPTEIPIPEIWSPELSEQQQKDYLDHIFAEIKIDPSLPLGIYRYGSIDQSGDLLFNSPVVSQIRNEITGDATDEAIVSGILLPANTAGDLLRYEPEVDWYGELKAENVPYYLLAVPMKIEAGKVQSWIILQVLKVASDCEQLVTVNQDGKGEFNTEDSTTYLRPFTQIQTELNLEGLGFQEKCLAFTPEQQSVASIVFGLAKRAEPGFWETIEQIREVAPSVLYLGTPYSTHFGSVYPGNQ